MGLVTEDSLNLSMDKAVQHYSSLFRLPSYKRVISLQALACIGGGSLSTVILFPFLGGLINGLLNGLVLGFSLFIVNFVLDCVVSMLVLRGDPLFDFRRTAAVSMACMILWFAFVFIGAALGTAFRLLWWVRLCLLGFSAVLILRLVVINSTSRLGPVRVLIASFLQPLFCLVPFLMLWAKVDYPVTFQVLFFVIVAVVIALSSTLLFLFLLNRVGKQTLGVPSFSLLKGFLLNWVLSLNVPLEELFEKLGEDQDVEVFLMKFGSSVTKTVVVVPAVHPGPFKNLGSSALPSMLKTALEKELDCVVSVPHGLFGHELDLASQDQSQKLINYVIESADFLASEARASPFVTASNGTAVACCQIFGNFVFISFSLAPATTEDFPKELGLFVRKEAEKHGLTCVGVVNAHNSIDGPANMQEALPSLKAVAATCLEKAASLRRLLFDVGAATVSPKQFTLDEGMGPGGITTVVVSVGGQKAAYVVIDGNNMISGLRGEILSALRSMGMDEGEVFTTDTHAVNAMVLNGRGYHPVGEIMDRDRLIGYIKEATGTALTRLERVKKASCCNVTVPKVKVIGEKQLEKLCLFVDKSIRKAKRLVIPIFAGTGLLLMLTLILLIT
jgi:putative membrane protein